VLAVRLVRLLQTLVVQAEVIAYFQPLLQMVVEVEVDI
jgi:hypothetical protein